MKKKNKPKSTRRGGFETRPYKTSTSRNGRNGLKKQTPQSTPTKSSSWQLRPVDGQGVFTKYFKTYVPRKVEADFYEFLREAIPIIDAAIMRLISLDGHIVVKGNNESLVDEIEDWIYNVPVNDIQKGVQAFHQNLTNEAFEQGFGLGEFVTDRKRTDIVGLRVADSKFIKFKRSGNGLEIYQKANDDPDYRLLNPENLMYFSINNENQNPHGTPLMRSCEFVSKIFATILNSIGNVWERFGDPSFSIIYKTSKKDGADHASRRKVLQDEFDDAIRAKREGKSADFVRAIDKDSEIEIKIIGADGQVLEAEVPTRIVVEQIVAKTGLPPWMLGIHWSTTERLSNAEAEMLLADVATRQSAKMPLFYNLIRTMLLLRGRAWKKGDWWLEWGQVNLHDVVQQAQARFLNAQADMYYLTNAVAAGIQIDIGDLAIGKGLKDSNRRGGFKTRPYNDGGNGLHHNSCVCSSRRDAKSCVSTSATKELNRPSPWPALDKVEAEYEAKLKSDWADMQNTVFEIMKLSDIVKSAPCRDTEHRVLSGGDTVLRVPTNSKTPPLEGIPSIDAFTFSVEQRASIMKALEGFLGIYDYRNTDSAVRWYYGQSYSLGLIQAAKLIGKDRPILDIIKNREVFDELAKNGFTLLKNDATKRIVQKILPEIEAQVITGTNPTHVATRLRKLFGDANSDWERLARSEMSLAAEHAKIDEWEAWGVKKIEFTPAPDACPICMTLAGDYDINTSPIPVEDTHPRCRCSTRPTT